ncbi:MAG: carbohydrate deacetylase [Terriglobales bacterium]
MRRLIINADDLGLTAGVNRAVSEACRLGVVSSATAMANSRAVEDAVAAFRSCGNRPSLGCHVVLVDGEPLLPPSQVSTLLARDGDRPQFRDGFFDFAACAIRGQIDASQIEAEATAQIRKIQASGIQLSHVDTHKHVHLLPAILRPLLRVAKSCGVRAVRNPFAPIKPLAFAHLVRRPHLWKRYSEVKILRGLASSFRRTVADADMVTTDGTFGIVATGALDERLFHAIVGCIPEGTWEFVCHPGYNDEELQTVRTRLRESREQELRVLTSDAARQALKDHGIEVISYWDLR